MTSLILTNHEGEPVVDSRHLAQGLGIKHENFYETIKDNLVDFEEFGGLRFETGTLNTNGGMQKVKFALLNEDQAYFAVTLSRNSKQVVAVKRELVRAFRDARNQALKLPSRTELCRMVIEAERKLGITEEINDAIWPVNPYGSLTPDGRPRVGVRRAAFVASAARLRDAALLMEKSAQLELQGIE